MEGSGQTSPNAGLAELRADMERMIRSEIASLRATLLKQLANRDKEQTAQNDPDSSNSDCEVDDNEEDAAASDEDDSDEAPAPLKTSSRHKRRSSSPSNKQRYESSAIRKLLAQFDGGHGFTANEPAQWAAKWKRIENATTDIKQRKQLLEVACKSHPNLSIWFVTFALQQRSWSVIKRNFDDQYITPNLNRVKYTVMGMEKLPNEDDVDFLRRITTIITPYPTLMYDQLLWDNVFPCLSKARETHYLVRECKTMSEVVCALNLAADNTPYVPTTQQFAPHSFTSPSQPTPSVSAITQQLTPSVSATPGWVVVNGKKYPVCATCSELHRTIDHDKFADATQRNSTRGSNGRGRGRGRGRGGRGNHSSRSGQS
jgi:hypothetical protein